MKKLLIPVLAAGVIGVGLFAVNRVNAQTTEPPYMGLVQKIAKTFSLDESKVKAIFDEEHAARRTERKEHMQDRVDQKLSQAVTDGKLTEGQKAAIIKKLAEVDGQTKPEDFKNMTPEQRKSAMQKLRDDLKAWALSQGIDPSFVAFGPLRGRTFFK